MRVQADRCAVEAVPQSNRETTLRLTRVPLALVGLEPDRGCLRSVKAALGDGRRPVAGRPLAVGWEGRGETLIIWLRGALERVTAIALDHEFDTRASAARSVVIDLTGLESIDTSGLDTLTRIHRRATHRGDRLSFRHRQHVAQRPLGLVRAVQLRSEWAPRRRRRADEDSFFTLAMAGADVDHLRLGDRPGAA